MWLMKRWIRYSLLSLVLVVLGGASLLYCMWPGVNDIVVEPLRVQTDKWPSNTRPARIVLLADEHLAKWDEDYLKAIIDKTLALKPDVVILLGDYLSALAPKSSMAHDKIADMHAPLLKQCPVYYVMGNHEEVKPAKLRSIKKEFARVGLQNIESINRLVGLPNGQKIQLAGLRFSHAKLKPYIIKRMARLQASEYPLLIVSHTPWPFDQEKELQYDFAFAGHTHGGQICWPDGTPAFSLKRYSKELQKAGLKQGANDKPYYISRGLGMSQVPFRINCPPEITLIELCGSGPAKTP